MVSITKIFSFCGSHILPCHKGKCKNLHGHNYKLEVEVAGEVVSDFDRPDNGMIMDFGELKKIVTDKLLEGIDHTHLNQLTFNPTAEILVVKFAAVLQKYLDDDRRKVIRVRLWESDDSYAEWRE